MTKAPPSGRAANKVHLNLQVPVPNTDVIVPMSIPVSLFTGTVSDHGIKRSQYLAVEDGEDREVGSQPFDKITGDPVPYDEIVKKIHTEHGPVYVEDHEIEDLFNITPDTITLKVFQPLHMFHQGHYVPKSLQFLEPQVTGTGKNKGPDINAVKVLNAVFAAMRKEGVCALLEVTTRGVPKPAILTPDGVLWFVYHTDALREQRELPEYDVPAGELALFTNLVKENHSVEVQDLTDERSALIQDFADNKAAEGDFSKPDVPTVTKEKPAANDIMAQLMASVELAEAKAKGA